MSCCSSCSRAGNAHDVIRRTYLHQLSGLTGRNTIVYYSAWLQKPQFVDQQPEPFLVNDNDMNGFMATIHGMDKSLGLDLMLHTPGGNLAATESLVSYLRSMFGTDIRAIVPQLAMSAGTMIACAPGIPGGTADGAGSSCRASAVRVAGFLAPADRPTAEGRDANTAATGPVSPRPRSATPRTTPLTLDGQTQSWQPPIGATAEPCHI